MIRFVIYLKIECIPNLEPLKIYNECHKFKSETFKKNKKCKMLVQIYHVINHMFLDNHTKIQIIICNLYIFKYVFIDFHSKIYDK